MDGYLSESALVSFRFARVYAFFWTIGALTILYWALNTATANIAILIIGWLICGGSAIYRALKSPDHKKAKAKHRERMRGTDMGVRLFSTIFFWLGELLWPVLIAPINNLIRIFIYCLDGANSSIGLSLAETEKLSAEEGEKTSFSDHLADSILDMTSPETTGVYPTLKGEVKVNEFGETMFRDEATQSWKKVTRIGSDAVEIDGKKYRIR